MNLVVLQLSLLNQRGVQPLGDLRSLHATFVLKEHNVLL